MKNNKKYLGLIILTVIGLILVGCLNEVAQNEELEELDISLEKPEKSSGEIFLYGEHHGEKNILDKEIELWSEYYSNQEMRHLFIENAYYTAEFLNIWMESDNNDILDDLYLDWKGTASHSPYVKDFFKKIKNQYPETVFHGTDVGHQFRTTGKRFIEYLERNNLESSEQYLLAKKSIAQGKEFYKNRDFAYRENKMVENFIREFDQLNNENVMGIYGRAHTGLDEMDHTNTVPSMANQLKERYGKGITSNDLSSLAKIQEPLRIDKIFIVGKEYEASYFGKQNLDGLDNYTYREFWRIEDAYLDFIDLKKTQDVLPYNNYPMLIDEHQVFVIDYAQIDGTIIRKYYRSDGRVWKDQPSTEEFKVD